MNDNICSDAEFIDMLVNLMSKQRNFSSNLSRIEKFKPLREWIYRKTDYLFGDDPFYTMGNRIYYIVNDLHELPKCANPSCGRVVKHNFTAFSPLSEFFDRHCSIRCTQLDPSVKSRIEKTTMERYGCLRGNPTEDSKLKRMRTCMERFGYKSALESPEIQEKIHKSLQEHYGVDNPFNSEVIRNRAVETNLKRYGTTSSLTRPEIRKKIKDTLMEKYGTTKLMDIPDIREKSKESMLRKYGSEWYTGTKECHNLQKLHLNEHFDEIMEKRKKTNLERYGNEYGKITNTPEFREILMEKYGVEHTMQSNELRKKAAVKYTYNGVCFYSIPEISYYIWLTDTKKDFEYQPNIKFEYVVHNEKHYYFPDFLVEGEIIEIKGNQFFDKNGNMICPYRNKNMTDDDYMRLCEVYEAKHQCMLKHDVKILRNKDYKIYVDYVKTKYGLKFLKSLKNK